MSAQVNRIINALNIPLRVLLVLAIVAALAWTIYFFIFATSNLTKDSDDSTSSNVVESRVDAEDIVRADLFGKVEEAPAVQEIKETALNLSLTGVLFNATDPAKSIAIIKQGNRSSEKYYVGDRIAGVAELTEILEDRVIITRNGQREWLAFDEPAPIFEKTDETSFLFEHPTDAQYITQAEVGIQESEIKNEAETTTETLNQWLKNTVEKSSKRLESEPNAVLAEWGLAPLSEDEPEGYRMDEAMAGRVGLQSGDVIVAVNGTAVGNLSQDLPKIQQHLENETLELTVQRGDDTMKVSIKLN
ncbi:MAG: PDZ domain-containing protein [Gammaproteobacteria bacterium]|nr:PDZ domain-containing protein [Gammaproteobacteria bacterium]